MKNKFIQIFFAMLMLMLILLTVFSCAEETEENILVRMEIPVITIGNPDTLKLEISTISSLRTIRVSESNAMYINLDWQIFGKATREYNLNLIYDPNSPGDKNFDLYVEDGISGKQFPFTVKVIEELTTP